jgi:hypothetical protein
MLIAYNGTGSAKIAICPLSLALHILIKTSPQVHAFAIVSMPQGPLIISKGIWHPWKCSFPKLCRRFPSPLARARARPVRSGPLGSPARKRHHSGYMPGTELRCDEAYTCLINHIDGEALLGCGRIRLFVGDIQKRTFAPRTKCGLQCRGL